MLWLFFSVFAYAQIDGSTVTCPKGQYSNLGDTPILRFLSNKSHIILCGKDKGRKEGDSYHLTEFEVYYYNPVKKRLMPKLATTKKGERYRVYSVSRSLFFEESAYTGAKRVPIFQNSILCAGDGVCSFSALECIFDKKKSNPKYIVNSLRERLEKARCL